MAEERRITIMGATGYTGRLIAAELQRRGVAFVVAGRSEEKVTELARRVDAVEAVVADVRNRESLARLAQRSAVVINCAGPFVDLGEPVVLAAIENGAHYLDTTGEQPFIRAMRAHDEKARQARIAVVPAMAFEIALSDCGAAVAAEGFADIESIRVTYALAMHASQGTQRTALRMLAGDGWVYLRGKWLEQPLAKEWIDVDLGAPVGRVTAASFPSAEVITIPWHIRTREVRAFMRLPGLAAWGLSLLRPMLPLLGRAAARWSPTFVGEGTDGPAESERAESHFQIAVDVRGVTAGRARWRRLLLRGVDPYGLTAIIAVNGAQRICQPGYDRCGVLAPASAVEPRSFLDSISGLEYELSEMA